VDNKYREGCHYREIHVHDASKSISAELDCNGGGDRVEIHSEECPDYRCHECGGKCVVFVLARDNELHLCGHCFEKLRNLFQSATTITAATIRDAGRRVKSSLSQNRIVKLRSALRTI
jgi:predicted nucleic acid-binding Zn ribbon protein